MDKKKELGIYIHIPFCKRKCFYCDFISYTGYSENSEYIEAIKKEIETYKLNDYIVTSIYIGGGTPSYINSFYIESILKNIRERFNLSEDCEITIEVNPGTVTFEKLKTYKKCGINRLSIGLQTVDNELLKLIGRIHTYEEFINTYKMAKEIGFENMNIDLIIGIPNQTLEDIKKEIEKIINLRPSHISTYSLIVEEGTKLAEMLDEASNSKGMLNGKRFELPSEETERKMYWYIKNKLEELGYNHYEISNFAIKGKESRHNVNCWKQKEYIGLGVAAHSYLDKVRYSNIESVESYVKNIKNGKILLNRIIQETQNLKDMKKEYMLLGLRKIDGISIKDFKYKFSENPIFIFRNELNKLQNEELIEIDGDNIKLTNKGIDLANLVWQEFI